MLTIFAMLLISWLYAQIPAESVLDNREEFNEMYNAIFGHEVTAFYAYELRSGRITPSENMMFSETTQNDGNGYNPSTGYFTAPSAGLYLFTWRIGLYSGKHSNTEIHQNGASRGILRCQHEGGEGLRLCTSTMPLLLNTSDTVNIRKLSGDQIDGYPSGYFTGFKVHPTY